MMSRQVRVAALALACAWLTPVVVAQTTPPAPAPTPMQQAAGQAATMPRPSASSVVNGTRAADVVPNYGANDPANRSRFDNGRGNNAPAGNAAVSACAGANDPTCNAVQVLQGSPDRGVQFPIQNNDPLVVRSNSIATGAGRPGSPIPDLGSIGATAGEVCQTTTTTTPAVTAEEICTETRLAAYQGCQVGVTVPVDPDYIYQCITRNAADTNVSCAVGRVISVDAAARYQCDQQDRAQTSATCLAGRNIVVSANTQYQCEVRPMEERQNTCTRTLDLQCPTPSDGCDSGGIVPGSVAGDMAVSFGAIGGGNYALDFGSAGDNIWRGYPGVVDRQLTFRINRLAEITQFRLAQANFDDWIRITLNGQLVFNGPLGGDRLELAQAPVYFHAEPITCGYVQDEFWAGYRCSILDCSGWDSCYQTVVGMHETCTAVAGGFNCSDPSAYLASVQYCGTTDCIRFAELNTSWVQYPNVDLRPFLREGDNVLQMRVIVYDGGEGWIRINSRMICPVICTDNWITNCGPLEARTR